MIRRSSRSLLWLSWCLLGVAAVWGGPSQSDASGAAPALPSDQPVEQADFKQQAAALVDRGLRVQPTEMPAYLQLLRWSQAASPEALAARSIEVPFTELMLRPREHRGDLVRLDLIVNRVEHYEIPDPERAEPRVVYELVGKPANGRGWLYVVVTSELPAGLPEQGDTDTRVTVTGYFLKVQGYQALLAKPGDGPLGAPLLIGRVAVRPTPNPQATRSSSPMWFLAALAAGALLVVVNFAARAVFRSRPRRTYHSPASGPDDGRLDSETRPDDGSFAWLDPE